MRKRVNGRGRVGAQLAQGMGQGLGQKQGGDRVGARSGQGLGRQAWGRVGAGMGAGLYFFLLTSLSISFFFKGYLYVFLPSSSRISTFNF